MQSFQNGLKGVNNQLGGANRANQSFMRGMSDNRRAVQQAGFQLADLSVQIAGGQNAMLAFAQQGGQILQFFGAFGAVAGAALATFAAVAMSMSKTGDAATDAANRQVKALELLKDAIGEVGDAIDKLRFGGSASAYAENEISKLKSQVSGTMTLISNLQSQIETATTGTAVEAALVARDMAEADLKIQQDKLAELRKQLGILQANQEAQRMLTGGLSVAAGIQRGLIYDKEVELRQNREAAVITAQTAATDAYRKNIFHAMAGEAGSVSMYMDDTFMAGLGFSKLDINHGINVAANSAAQLAANLNVSLATAQKMMNLGYEAKGPVIYDPRDPKYNKAAAMQAGHFGFEYQNGLKVDKPKKDKAGGGADKKDPLVDLRAQLALESMMLGKTEEQQRVIRALGVDWQKYGDVVITGLTGQIAEIEAFNRKVAEQQSIVDTIKSGMEDAFMGIVDGTMKAKDAFKSMAASIISELFRVLVVQRLVGTFSAATGVGTGIVGMLGRALTSYEGGGYTGYGARAGGVDGKGGFAAILHPNETVVDHTQGGAAGVAITQNISFGSGVTRAEVQTMIPKIVEATKAAVLDARKRGGKFGGAFA